MENNTTDYQLKSFVEKYYILNEENEKRVAELGIANKELIIQHEEKDKCSLELLVANKKLISQNEEKDKCTEDLISANKELMLRNEEKEKRVSELEEMLFIISHKERPHISRILGMSDLIEKNANKPDDLLRNMEYIKQSAQALDGIKEKELPDVAALIINNKDIILRNEEKKKRLDELEEMLLNISYKERLHISRILGVSDFIEKNVNKPDELLKEVENIKQSAIALDEITREMTKFIESLLPLPMKYNEYKQ